MSDGYRFCVSIKLNTHTDDEQFLRKSFRIGEIMKQRTESFLSKQLDKLRMDRLYCDALESYHKVTNAGKSVPLKARSNPLKKPKPIYLLP